MDSTDPLYSSDADSSLRDQALDLFDRCLVNHDLLPIKAFIERQIMCVPPDLELFRDFADDLQHRLISLRAYHFDVREKVVVLFRNDYKVDISPLIPAANLAHYHEINHEQIIAHVNDCGVKLSSDDILLLRTLLSTSAETAFHLQQDIELVVELQTLILDWLDALAASLGRHYWFEIPPESHLFQ